MVKVRFFTLEERYQIQYLLSRGYSARKIARELERSLNGIIHELKKNDGKDYDAVTAHAKRRMPKVKLQEVHKKPLEKPRKTSNEKRISNLEMQVEILIETVRSLYAKNK